MLRAIVSLPYIGFEGMRDLAMADLYRIMTAYTRVIDVIVFSTFVALGLYLGIPVHELMHRAGDMIAGGKFGQVYVDPSFGGAVYQYLLPGVITDQSSSPLAILGAGSTTSNFAHTGSIFDYLHSIALQCGPSIFLTPLGLGLLKHGIKRKRPEEAGLGFSFALVPLLDLTDLAGVFLAFVNGASFTAADAISTMAMPELVAYLAAGAILAGLFYKAFKALIGRLDKSRASQLEHQLFDS